MSSLNNKHIFIAGGSRGIGASTAIHAASLGANISLTYNHNQDAANEVVKQITDAGGKAQALKADVVEESSIAKAVEDAVTSFGPINGVVISAGVFEHRKIEDMDLEFWQRTQNINMLGTVWTTKSVVKHMREAKQGGSIVIYTSTAGQSGGDNGAVAYCVSKAGQISFARCMAKELGPDNIRVNSLAPAWTETDMAKKHLDRIGRENVDCPLGRVGLPLDIAKSTCYLLSDDAGFVTGTCHTVDGGMAMRG